MLYALIGTLLAGSLATVFVLWRKARTEKALTASQKDLTARMQELADLSTTHAKLVVEYNNLVDHANAEIATLKQEKEELLNALEKSGKPGVFADLLRARNTKA